MIEIKTVGTRCTFAIITAIIIASFPIASYAQTNATDIFAVGDNGYFVHWDGTEWTELQSGTTGRFHAFWSNASDNAYVVGDNNWVFRFDGSSWQKIANFPARSVWGTDTGDIFAVGNDGILQYSESSGLSEMTGTSQKMKGVWASSASNVYAVGENGLFMHFDGAAWTSLPSLTSEHMNGIWGSASDNIYVIAEEGEIFHFDGLDWTQLPYFSFGGIDVITGSAHNDIYVLQREIGSNPIFHYDGSSWTRMTQNTEFVSLYAGLGTPVYGVGMDGAIGYFNGSSWVSMTSGVTSDLYCIWANSTSEVYAAGPGGVIIQYDGSDWTQAELNNYTLWSVWGSSPSDVYAVGNVGGIIHYDGAAISEISSGTTASLYAISGNSASDIYAVGSGGTILHFDGTDWTSMASGTSSSLSGIWCNGTDDIFAGGSYRTILHFDGLSWSEMESSSIEQEQIKDFWGNSSGTVLAVGQETVNPYAYKSLFRSFNGEVWTDVSNSFHFAELSGVWGFPGDRVFAGGENLIAYYDYGEVLHDFDDYFSPFSYPKTTNDYVDIWGMTYDDMYIIQHPEEILYYDGVVFSEISPTSGIRYHGIWGFGSPLTGETIPGAGLQLCQNYPNPFNPVTTIEFNLPSGGHVTLSVYDTAGRLITNLVDEILPQGSNLAVWDGSNKKGIKVASGIYFYRIEFGNQSIEKKMVLIR